MYRPAPVPDTTLDGVPEDCTSSPSDGVNVSVFKGKATRLQRGIRNVVVDT
jgi:hypothetical protein